MKLLLLTVISVISVMTHSYAKAPPQETSKLQTQRSTAILKIEESYKLELEGLKVDYTTKEDLRTANLIADLIKGSEGGVLSGTIMPPDLVDVESRRAASTAKINKIYKEELDKLKLKYSKNGDLESANHITLLMMDVPGELGLFYGEWIYTPAKGEAILFSVDEDNKVTCLGRTGSWEKVSDGRIRIVYDQSKNRWCEIMAKRKSGGFVVSTSEGQVGSIDKNPPSLPARRVK